MATASTRMKVAPQEPQFINVVHPQPVYQDFDAPAVNDYPARPVGIAGKRIAFLPNWKNGLRPFVRTIAERMDKDTDVSSAFYVETNWLYTHPDHVGKIPAEADKLAEQCDLMVSGVGDCGGCTLWSVKACVEFEKRGIPTAVVVTDVFEKRAHQLLTSLGYPHIPVVVTANPVIYLTGAEAHARIDGGLLKDVVTALTAR
jgi:hypothetical protein